MTQAIQKPRSADEAMALVARARAQLGQAKTFTENLAAMKMAQATKLLLAGVENARAAQVDAGAIQVAAVRRLGELLEQTEKHKGGRPPKPPAHAPEVLPPKPKLKELNVSEDQSRRWQRAARVPQSVTDDYMERCKAANLIPSPTGVIKHAKHIKEEKRGEARRANQTAAWADYAQKAGETQTGVLRPLDKDSLEWRLRWTAEQLCKVRENALALLEQAANGKRSPPFNPFERSNATRLGREIAWWGKIEEQLLSLATAVADDNPLPAERKAKKAGRNG